MEVYFPFACPVAGECNLGAVGRPSDRKEATSGVVGKSFDDIGETVEMG